MTITGEIWVTLDRPEDIRRVRAGVSGVLERRSCQVLGVSRAGLHRMAAAEGPRRGTDQLWTERLREWIQHESMPILVEIAKRPPLWVARPVRGPRLLLSFGVKNGLRIGSRINDRHAVYSLPWAPLVRRCESRS